MLTMTRPLAKALHDASRRHRITFTFDSEHDSEIPDINIFPVSNSRDKGVRGWVSFTSEGWEVDSRNEFKLEYPEQWRVVDKLHGTPESAVRALDDYLYVIGQHD